MQVLLSWYQVSDFEAAKAFYGDVLGLKQVFEMDGWVEFSHADGAAAIGLARQTTDEKGATVVLKVDNLDRARDHLIARGVRFEGEIEEVSGVVRIATFRDPSGNRLQIIQSDVAQ